MATALQGDEMTKATEHYGNLLKGYNVKQLGPKPGDDVLAMVHTFARPGKQALALALMTRECGVTGGQIVQACGAPQLNKMRDLCKRGLFKRVAAPMTEAGHTVYRIELTAKGAAKVKAAAEKPVDAEPVKPAKAKRKAKAKPVEAPAVAPAPVDVGGVDAERAAVEPQGEPAQAQA